MTSLRARVERLIKMAGGLHRPSRLDQVDLVTLMDLATHRGGEDVGDLWRRNLAAMGVEDDGSGEGRVAAIRGRVEADAR